MTYYYRICCPRKENQLIPYFQAVKLKGILKFITYNSGCSHLTKSLSSSCDVKYCCGRFDADDGRAALFLSRRQISPRVPSQWKTRVNGGAVTVAATGRSVPVQTTTRGNAPIIIGKPPWSRDIQGVMGRQYNVKRGISKTIMGFISREV